MSMTTPPGKDIGTIVRSRGYLSLLALAAVIGLGTSVACWAFLELIARLQPWVYQDLPNGLFGSVPTWWPIPVLVVAGTMVAAAVRRFPGSGGHEPADGLAAESTTAPADLPGILVASIASVGLGLVLGPEAPLLALGAGLGVMAVKRLKRDAPDEVVGVMAAAGSFAALSSLFGSPIIGAVIIIEAAGLGGPTLPLILMPGLLAAGIGSLVFIGMGSLTGLDSSAYALAPLSLPTYDQPTLGAFAWTIALSVVVAVVVFAIGWLAKRVQLVARKRRMLVTPIAALAVAGLAMAFGSATGHPADLVLFSGQDALGGVVQQAATLSTSTLIILLACKGLAYAISLGIGRGGPTFPAMFLGVVAGLLAANLPGFSQTPAIAALMGAATVAMLRLPLASALLAMLITQASLATAPLIIVAVVVAYLTVERLSARFGPPESVAGRPSSPEPATGG